MGKKKGGPKKKPPQQQPAPQSQEDQRTQPAGPSSSDIVPGMQELDLQEGTSRQAAAAAPENVGGSIQQEEAPPVAGPSSAARRQEAEPTPLIAAAKGQVALPFDGLKRPGFGTAGTHELTVISNSFPIQLTQAASRVYRYDVEIYYTRHQTADDQSKKQLPAKDQNKKTEEPDSNKRSRLSAAEKSMFVLLIDQIQQRVMSRLEITLVFDQVCNVLTNKPIPENNLEFRLQDLGDRFGESFGKSFTVVFKLGKVLDLTKLIPAAATAEDSDLESLSYRTAREERAELLQALEWIISYGSVLERVPRGKCFYEQMKDSPDNSKDLSVMNGELKLRFGFFKSAQACTQSGLCLTIDRAANMFIEPLYIHQFAAVVKFSDLFERQKKLKPFEEKVDLRKIVWQFWNQRMDSSQCKKLSDLLDRVKVKLMYGPIHRTVTATGVTIKSADEIKFKPDKGSAEEITVEEYFRRQYNITLKFPKLPCVTYGQDQRKVPMELCWIVPNQVCPKSKLTSKQQSQMVSQTASNPEQRLNAVYNGWNQLDDDASEILKTFGIEIGYQPIEANARILRPPTLLYGVKSGQQPVEFTIPWNPESGDSRLQGGAWNFPKISDDSEKFNSLQFLKPATIGKDWALMILNEEHGKTPLRNDWVQENFILPLINQARRLGISIDWPCHQTELILSSRVAKEKKQNAYKDLQDCFQKISQDFSKLKLLIIILPYGQKDDAYKNLYEVIKYLQEVSPGGGGSKIGIPTQCLKAENIYLMEQRGFGGRGGGRGRGGGASGRGGRGGGGRGAMGGGVGGGGDGPAQPTGPDNMKLINILLKINAKAKGKNVSFSYQKTDQLNNAFPKHFMVIGADVTHPAPGDKLDLAVASVVGSMDIDCARWWTKITVQTNVKEGKQTNEMINNFDQIVVEMVKRYKERHGALPEALIVYRDGVSQGQLAQVLDKEINPLQAALRREFSREIYITCINAQKRHHARLFPREGEILATKITTNKAGIKSGGNLLPGTVVDSEICKQNGLDFYMISQIAIKGTARPTHYEVLRDDLFLSVDTLQAFTYALCHIYTRCSRAIAIPVPVAYADLAAYRGRKWIIGYQDVELGGRKLGTSREEEKRAKDVTAINELFQNVSVSDELLFYS